MAEVAAYIADEEVTYNLIPTIKAFHESPAQIRALVGPVGCYSGDTEFLTLNGWVRFDSPLCADFEALHVAQWNRRTKRVSFVKPSNYIKEPCAEFISFSNTHSLSMLLSEEHRMPLYDYRGVFKVRQAFEVELMPSRYTVPTVFRIDDQEDYPLSDAELRLMVAFHADGNIPAAGQKCRIALRKEWKKTRLIALLNAAGLEFTTGGSANRPSEMWYAFIPPRYTKTYAEWGWRLSERQLKIVVDELQFWDGLFEGDDYRFSTTVKGDADFVQYAVHATGGRATISTEVYENPKWKDCYTVHIALPGSYKAKVMLRGDTTSIERVPSEDGFKYCFTVPTSFLVVRHDGRVFISGNSGKTTGATWEICYYLPHYMYKTYGIKKTRWVIVRNCYDAETEILTEYRGWRLFKDLSPDDKVAMLDNDKTVFVTPSYYYKKHYTGEMVGFEGEDLNFLVTPDHNLSISLRNARKKEWSPYRFRHASDCYGKTNMRVRRSAGWDGEPSDFSVDMFEWLGYWFADGSTTVKEYNGSMRHNCIITAKKERKLLYARDIFVRAGLPFTENVDKGSGVHRFRLSVNDDTRPLILLLAACGKATTKKIPVEWKGAPAEHLSAFLKGFIAGDGSIRKNAYTVTGYTSSLSLVNDLQEIALKAGHVLNINKTVNEEGANVFILGRAVHVSPNYTFTLLSKRKHSPVLRSEKDKSKSKYLGWYKKMYDDMVYCLEVPTHIVYVRRRGRAFWCSQTTPEIRDTTLATVMEWFGFARYRVQAMIMNLEYPGDGNDILEVEILFRACDNEKHVRQFKSLEVTGYWIDESIEVSDSTKHMLKTRIGRYPRKSPVRFGIETTNPPDIEHTMYNQFAWITPPPGPMPTGKPLKGHVGFWQPPLENVANLREGYYDDLREDYADNPDWADMYIDGKPGQLIRGKLVYKNFRRLIHVAEEPLTWGGQAMYRGWDNSGNTPACVVVSPVSPQRLHIFKEFHTKRENIVEFTERVIRNCNESFPDAVFIDYGDPAGEQTYSTREGTFTSNAGLQASECGVVVIPSQQNMAVRVNAVDQALLKRDGILIDPRCTRLINGFLGGYHYPELRGMPDVYKKEVEKNKYSHCFVGGTPVLLGSGESIGIEEIQVGDLVATPDGAKRVTATMNRFSSELVELTFSNGTWLTCTKDHPFITSSGQVDADALQYTDVMYGVNILKEEKLWEEKRNTNLKRLKGLSIIESLKAITKQITRRMGASRSICIEMYGAIRTVRYLKDTVYIIRTGIERIINSITSSFCQFRSMLRITGPNGCCEIQLEPGSECLNTLSLQLLNGTEVKKGANGIESTGLRHGKDARRSTIHAFSVVKNIPHLKEQEKKDSAAQHVRVKHEGSREWTILKSLVSFAVRCLERISTQRRKRAALPVQARALEDQKVKLLSKKYITGSQKVYDLTVEDAHCFYADGILVSNCHDALQYVCVMLYTSLAPSVSEDDVYPEVFIETF